VLHGCSCANTLLLLVPLTSCLEVELLPATIHATATCCHLLLPNY
jgi:hypothetical protein